MDSSTHTRQSFTGRSTNMGANSNDLRVLDAGVVGPSDLDLPPRSLPLTFFDVLWLTSPPVERVFFYRLAADADVPAILSNLKASLSQALHAYYPLAGRLRLAPGTAARCGLRYQPGDGVSFTVAEYDHVGVGELATDEPTELARTPLLVQRLLEGGDAAWCSLCRPACCAVAASPFVLLRDRPPCRLRRRVLHALPPHVGVGGSVPRRHHRAGAPRHRPHLHPRPRRPL